MRVLRENTFSAARLVSFDTRHYCYYLSNDFVSICLKRRREKENIELETAVAAEHGEGMAGKKKKMYRRVSLHPCRSPAITFLFRK